MRTLPIIFRSIAAAVLACLLTAPVALADAGENTALNLPDTGETAKVSHSSSGGSIVRTIAGLAIVLGVIYGLTWVLKKVKAAKETTTPSSGGGLEQVATLPLGGNRSLHLVRAGDELVLIGAAEHGVTPIRRFSETEAIELGLIDGPRAATLATLGEEPAAPARPKGFLAALRSKTVMK